MASLDELINKIPRTALVAGVFIIALGLIVYTNPLQDGCDVQVANFKEDVKGYLINTKTKNKKMKMAEVNTSKDFCKNGNSQGACENYFSALSKISEAFVRFDHQCMVRLSEDEALTNLEPQLKDALKILALLAWGEKPPDSVADRLGWIAKSEVYTFCRLKSVLVEIMGEEAFKEYRFSVYKEFPAQLPEQFKNQIGSEDVQRPGALKWSGNLNGTLTQEDVFQRSLFSLRCELYQ